MVAGKSKVAATATDASPSSENGSASADVDYTAYPPPVEPPSEKATLATTPAQAEMHRKVLEHFQSESYQLPGVQNGDLLEDEKFWLVSFIFTGLG